MTNGDIIRGMNDLQSEPKLPYTHLLLVNTCFEFKVYVVNTKDIFHTMGEFIYRSFEKVKRITFVEYTQVKLNYFKNESIPIYEFRNKYPYIKR